MQRLTRLVGTIHVWRYSNIVSAFSTCISCHHMVVSVISDKGSDCSGCIYASLAIGNDDLLVVLARGRIETESSSSKEQGTLRQYSEGYHG